MLCALIMAGGIGSRFWPQSTPKRPKQFLKLINDKTMLQMTYDRIRKLIPDDNIYIVTNERYIDLVKEQIPKIKNINIITEPCSKNTAPCILLSSLYIKNIYNDANVVCISSDSYIQDEDKFLKNIKCASDYVNDNKKAIVTIGINPTRPEIGYGYIKYEKSKYIPNKVIKFVEKPDLEKAREYMDSNDYLWNAGMFIFNNLNMIEELKSNLPNEFNLLKDLPAFDSHNYKQYLNNNYEKCEKISIDYAVMEKSENVYTIPSDIGWDDLGTWESLERYLKKDDYGNIIKGNVQINESKNNIVYGDKKKIILKNVDNLFCIDSEECIIIGKKSEINDVPNLKDK